MLYIFILNGKSSVLKPNFNEYQDYLLSLFKLKLHLEINFIENLINFTSSWFHS